MAQLHSCASPPSASQLAASSPPRPVGHQPPPPGPSSPPTVRLAGAPRTHVRVAPLSALDSHHVMSSRMAHALRPGTRGRRTWPYGLHFCLRVAIAPYCGNTEPDSDSRVRPEEQVTVSTPVRLNELAWNQCSLRRKDIGLAVPLVGSMAHVYGELQVQREPFIWPAVSSFRRKSRANLVPCLRSHRRNVQERCRDYR